MGVYTWTIGEYKSYEDKRVIHSPTFEKGDYTWRLWLFPKGSANASEGDMSLFLHYVKQDDVFSIRPLVHPKAKFSIRIKNQADSEDIQHEIYDFHDFGESNGEWGWKDFAEIERLYEEEGGLVVNGVMRIELSVFVQPKRASLWPIASSSEAKMVEVRVLTDQQMRREIGKLHFAGLPLLSECRSYCLYEHMKFCNIETFITKNLRVELSNLRLWLCEQLQNGHIRIVKNLQTVSLDTVSDLTDLKRQLLPTVEVSDCIEQIDLYVECPGLREQSLREINEEKDFVVLCKYYDPWKIQLSYLGAIPLRHEYSMAEILVDARMLADLPSKTEVSVYLESPPCREIVQEIKPDDKLESVVIRPGSTIIVQQKVDPAYAQGKDMKHPTVKSFLKDTEIHEQASLSTGRSQESPFDTEPHDDLCVVCFNRPRTVGFLHGDSLHRCVCQECGPQVLKEDTGNCPLCRKKIDRVVLNIF